MDTSQFRGRGPARPPDLQRGRARRCTARPASSHDVGNATYSTEAAPLAAHRRSPRTALPQSLVARGAAPALDNKVGHQHHSRHGAPDATQRWGSSQILSCFRAAGNCCKTLPASGRAPRVVAVGSAVSQKHFRQPTVAKRALEGRTSSVFDPRH